MWLMELPKNFEKMAILKIGELEKKTSCHIFKMDIFSKLFSDFMSYIIGKNAGKRIRYFLIFYYIENRKVNCDLFARPVFRLFQ
jgi:hypothetical protein